MECIEPLFRGRTFAIILWAPFGMRNGRESIEREVPAYNYKYTEMKYNSMRLQRENVYIN